LNTEGKEESVAKRRYTNIFFLAAEPTFLSCIN
jgi:hypothetical protein